MSLADIVELSRYYGSRPEYVIAGGGNTSFKDEKTLYIKGSGAALADIGPEGFVKMDREKLAAIWEKNYPPAPDEREAAVLADMMAAREAGEEGKRPSVETLLHDILPFRFVVHLHPALVNALTCSQRGEEAAAELFSSGNKLPGNLLPDTLWLPSSNPGFVLSRLAKDALDDYRGRTGKPAPVILLQNHGIFAGADSTEGIREHYRRIMETLEKRIIRKPDLGDPSGAYGPSREIGDILAEAAGETEPGLKTRAVLFLRNPEITALVKDPSSFYPLSRPFTPDHIVYAGSDPLFIETGKNGLENPRELVRGAWKEYRQRFGRNPKITALQGLGVFGIGETEKAARLALDLFVDGIRIAVYSEAFGGPRFMTPDQVDFINNWEVERYRIRVSRSE
ncbi:MAG: class II aldolase/adducin family protein [Treponema sp.]|jgi:rhamnose utilization protein RhaD (predicted bifunctional aldolase and dehydrogenase)|nr:class II aldolase/adducin family protein [Treponema sp.]